MHLVLRHDRGFAGIGAGLGLALHGQVLGEGLVGDDDGGGMDAVLATEPLETLGDVDHQLRVRVLLVHLAQLGCGHVAVLVTLDRSRHALSGVSRPMTSGGMAFAILSPSA